MGDVYFSKKDMEKSEEYFSKALSLDPGNPLMLSRMADIILTKKGPLNQALQYAEKAVSLSPSFSQPYETMAWVLIAMGNETDAEKYFHKAQKFGLTGYFLKFSKARAYFLKGDKEKAKIILREIAQMEDTPKEIKQAIQRE
jgi:tetratricopeptide (TPR) repeat protein